MLTAEQISPKRAVPMTRDAYHHLFEAGAYEGRRVQLIYGTVIDMNAMGTPHAGAIRVLNRFFVANTPPELDVMVQLPLAAAEDSEPEPDFAFVPRLVGVPEDHPATALLVVEVADSSLKLDLGPKATLYAECHVPEYWVLDLKARSTVVHRKPSHGKYTKVRRISWTTQLASTAVPSLRVRFASVFHG